MNNNIELYNIIIKYEKNELHNIRINLDIKNNIKLYNIITKYK